MSVNELFWRLEQYFTFLSPMGLLRKHQEGKYLSTGEEGVLAGAVLQPEDNVLESFVS